MAVVEKVRAEEVRMLIGGEWMGSADGRTIAVENPGRRERIALVPRGGAADVERAVKAAAAAFPAWSRVPPRERGRMLLKIADAIEARAEELAVTIARETGNALRPQARPEAKGAADIFRYFGGLGVELKGETIPLSEEVLSYTRREPLAVVGAIIGELPSGLQDGLGGAIINFNQYYSLEPQELWATNVIAAALGIPFFVIVVAAEKAVVRRAPETTA